MISLGTTHIRLLRYPLIRSMTVNCMLVRGGSLDRQSVGTTLMVRNMTNTISFYLFIHTCFLKNLGSLIDLDLYSKSSSVQYCDSLLYISA